MGLFDFFKNKMVDVWMDKYTNLMWQLDVPSNLMTWYEAVEYVKELNSQNYCGYSDWRLPTIEEQELVHRYKNLDIAWKYKEKGINTNDFLQLFYWSSTTLGERVGKIIDLDSVTRDDMNDKAWNICIKNGMSGYDSKHDKQRVRLVRGDINWLQLLEQFGVDKTAELITEHINNIIPSEDIAMQFILEELDAASNGNEMAKQFVAFSGFDEDDYKDAMKNSFEDVDGASGPQQELTRICFNLYQNQDLMITLRLRVVDNIMKIWELGKYSAINNSERLIDIVRKVNNLAEGVFANINNDLSESINAEHDIMILMSYAYARRAVAAALVWQGVFSKNDYQQAKNVFLSLQNKTGQSVEFQEEAYEQALELLSSYDRRFTKKFASLVVSVVEQNQVENAYDNDKFFSDEKIFEIIK